MSDSPSSPADWYEDPEDPAQYRYWDGARWTDHRAPRTAAAQQTAAPVYAATPSGVAPQASTAPERPISIPPLLAAGALLILAGVARAVSFFLPFQLSSAAFAFSALEVLGWAAAFAAFLVAGYPARRTAPRVLAGVLIGVYVLSGAITLTLSTPTFGAGGVGLLVGLFGFATFGLGIAFGISAMRSSNLAPRLRPLPLALYAGLIVFGLLNGVVNGAIATGVGIPWQASLVVGGLSGVVPVVVGALFVAFGRAPNSSSVSYPVVGFPVAGDPPA